MVLSFGRKNLLKEIILPLSYKIKHTSLLIIKNALLIFIIKSEVFSLHCTYMYMNAV